MAVTFQITVDCNHPDRLVRFWTAALGYEPTPPPQGHSTWNEWYQSVGIPDDELDLTTDGTDHIRDPAGGGPPIWFQLVPEPKRVKNRLHLDLDIGGGRQQPLDERRRRVEAKAAELVAAGATVLHTDLATGFDHFFMVLADPEGNEFCLR